MRRYGDPGDINCRLPKEHELSKQWAAVIPPVNENFKVDQPTLFKFLTTPLENESMEYGHI